MSGHNGPHAWIHDGGNSWLVIVFCPWGGSSLAASQRDAQFDELVRLCVGMRWFPGDC